MAFYHIFNINLNKILSYLQSHDSLEAINKISYEIEYSLCRLIVKDISFLKE